MKRTLTFTIAIILICIILLGGCTETDEKKDEVNDEVDDEEENKSPTANASSDLSGGTSPVTIQFFGSGYDPDGIIVSYKWGFGDGGPTNTKQNSTHTFTNPGNYTVTFAVVDDDGATDSDIIYIHID